MKPEVATAVNFITTLMRVKGILSEDQLHHFNHTLVEVLGEHYEHHWFPDAPHRGSGYRCIRINHNMDPLVGKAANVIGLSREQVFSLLTIELTIWVDPYEVSYRIGENGSICALCASTPPQETYTNTLDSYVETDKLEPVYYYPYYYTVMS